MISDMALIFWRNKQCLLLLWFNFQTILRPRYLWASPLQTRLSLQNNGKVLYKPASQNMGTVHFSSLHSNKLSAYADHFQALTFFSCIPKYVHTSTHTYTAPHQLSNLLQPYTPARQLWSTSNTQTFVTPHVNRKTFGERLYPYTGPPVWNSLPQTLCHFDFASSFKVALWTHLFSNYF